jgi:hypothetical protein
MTEACDLGSGDRNWCASCVRPTAVRSHLPLQEAEDCGQFCLATRFTIISRRDPKKLSGRKARPIFDFCNSIDQQAT